MHLCQPRNIVYITTAVIVKLETNIIRCDKSKENLNSKMPSSLNIKEKKSIQLAKLHRWYTNNACMQGLHFRQLCFGALLVVIRLRNASLVNRS